MKKILLVLLLTAFIMNGYCATFTITNVSVTFSPATISITQNDNIIFTLLSVHNAVEVSQTTWNANDITPLTGGFNIGFGGGTLSGSQLSIGTHYFVCQNHVQLFGMKGTIIVQSTAGIEDHKLQNDILIFPSPAKDNITVQYNELTSKLVEIKLVDLQGKLVDVLYPKTELSGVFLRTFSLKKASSPGVYFIQISSGDNISYHKVVII